jgi:thiol-disulfide isomerase/thioredoxin
MSESKKRASRVLSVGLALAAIQSIAVVLYLGVEKHRNESVTFHSERVRESPPLPNIDLERADGSRLHSGDLRGRPTLLHFWATWCPPCREELPSLLRFANGIHDLQVVAVTLDEDWAPVREFFGGVVPPEIAREENGTLSKVYGLGLLPDTYLLDREGNAVLRFVGERDWNSPIAQEIVASYGALTQGAQISH